MPETISDTGPILHLREISNLPLLAPLSPLVIPDLVQAELDLYGVLAGEMAKAGIDLTVVPVTGSIWKEVLLITGFPRIQPADAQVFALARDASFDALVLTDDLALRKILEREGAIVVGSLGILIKAYRDGRLNRDALEQSVEDLLERSTLHLSRAFRAYVRQLIEDLP